MKHSIRMILFILVQGLIFGQLDFGYGIHPMVYPLFIILLPFEINIFLLILIAFFTGIGVDFFMNTFGLHASAALLVAYLRPIIFNYFSPRDGYDSFKEPTINSLGYAWFFKVAGILILIHHTWFFILEYFKSSLWTEIILNTFLSSVVSLFLFILIQIFFFKRSKI
ncbi:MAG: hypothetical protein H3C31_06040 [Brumimicrobium sp.]|nr:hypothetical protein [Brumimicrobium sp.]MCO5267332.1 hypothetical protein [Brumimicrobium sp.]